MTTAVLHRRLTAGMALAALAAFVAGAGFTPGTLAAGAALALACFRLPPPHVSRYVELAARVGILALFAWMVYVAFVLVGDFMPAVLGMLLFLLVAESLRSLDAHNDMRLYILALSLLIAATAYYPGLGFAVAFVSFIVLSSLALMVGFMRRQAEQFRAGDVRMGRRFMWTTVALCGVTLLTSVLVFIVFPRLPRQWNVQGRNRGGEVMTGFSDEVSLGEHGGRLQANPEVAFRVEFPDRPPERPEATYWRGRSFDYFDGVRWRRTRTAGIDWPRERYAQRWGGPFRRARIFGGPPGATVLFGEHPVLDVQPRSAFRYMRSVTGDLVHFGTETPVYTVTSAASRPRDQLMRIPGEDPGYFDSYLQLPELTPRTRRLADSLAALGGDRLDRAHRVEAYLHRFAYTLDLPRNRRQATLDYFLFERRAGHCEYFSTAMAVLLRAQGIPARNVTGFLGGEWNEGANYLLVTGNDAHSWVEVWFPEAGWVPFEPTPPGRADLVEGARGGWGWTTRFWLDGVEYRWYKWVIDYNLDRQLDVFRGVASAFGGGGGWSGGQGGRGRGPGPWGWVAAAVVLVLGAAWWIRGQRRAPLSPESRRYLALRRVYDRAGWARPGLGPLEWVHALHREGAPGADSAEQAVRLYLDVRFAGRDPDARTREALDAAAVAARTAVRASPRRRRGVPTGIGAD